jgi:hypothetical protein
MRGNYYKLIDLDWSNWPIFCIFSGIMGKDAVIGEMGTIKN